MMNIVWMFAVALLAFSTGKNTLLWTAAGYIFGWPALVVLVFLPKNEEKAQKRLDFINNKTQEVNAQNELKDVNTVDDLFKQLEPK
jgi:hypothetical protein